MQFKEREQIIQLLKSSEKKLSVNTWEINGVNMWPIIRIAVFFYDYDKTIKEQIGVKKILVYILKFLKVHVWYSFYFFKKIKLKKANFIFSGYASYRTMWNGSFFNKYFDPIMDEKSVKNESLIFEYEQKNNDKKYYKNKRVVDIAKLIHFFEYKTRRQKTEILTDHFKDYDLFLNRINSECGFNQKKLDFYIKDQIYRVFSWKKLWDFVLQKTGAKIVFALCYYNPKMTGLMLSAKEKGLISIDMQHGGQGAFHAAYSYTNIPEKGYSCLPDYFWCWDHSSVENIKQMTNKSTHDVLYGGNPWIDYLKKQNYSLKEKFILYSMQTNQEPILHDYIIEAIKETPKEYVWWLRLHPRMTKDEVTTLNNILKTHDILHRVEIEKATNLPLPIILFNSKAHVSLFSGCVIEANLMNVPVNIVMGDVGKEFYKDLIENKEVSFYSGKVQSGLWLLIEKELNNNRKINLNIDSNYQNILEEISKKYINGKD